MRGEGGGGEWERMYHSKHISGIAYTILVLVIYFIFFFSFFSLFYTL